MPAATAARVPHRRSRPQPTRDGSSSPTSTSPTSNPSSTGTSSSPHGGLKGRCPDLFDHPERGDEARKLFDDAQALLHRIADERLLTLQGVVGIYPAVSRGDDILLTDAKGRRHTLPMLRNQTRGAENLCLSDFIADRRDGATDYIGAFALTAGIGLQSFCDKFRSEGRRLLGHHGQAARRPTASPKPSPKWCTASCGGRWGYETAEAPTPQQVIAGEYRGRRMAFGYPPRPTTRSNARSSICSPSNRRPACG